MARGRRAGAKPKPSSKRMTRVIGLRVTEEEYRRLTRLAQREHVPLAAWTRARLLRSIEDQASFEFSRESFDARQQAQEETLAKAQTLLEETRRLYQSTVPATPDESEKED